MKMDSRNKLLLIIIAISIATIVLWQTDIGRLILYPFTVLGTWFHEMGHGLMALFLGGGFEKLDIYSNGSGVATWNGPLFLGNIGKAIVAGAGPMGPTIAGVICIVASAKDKWTKYALYILTTVLIISAIYWVRSLFGVPVVLGFGILTGLIAFKGNRKLQRFTLIFLGIQACLSVYLSIDYLMMSYGTVGGESMQSDTAVMEQYLFLPNYIWGGLIIFISILAIWKSLSYALKNANT